MKFFQCNKFIKDSLNLCSNLFTVLNYWGCDTPTPPCSYAHRCTLLQRKSTAKEAKSLIFANRANSSGGGLYPYAIACQTHESDFQNESCKVHAANVRLFTESTCFWNVVRAIKLCYYDQYLSLPSFVVKFIPIFAKFISFYLQFL